METDRRILGSQARATSELVEPRSLVADMSPDALNRLLRIYAGVIAAGVVATGAAASIASL